jgi:hypothetical protein
MITDVEKRRIQALHETGVLAEPSSCFDRIAELARRLFDVPFASVTFVGSDIVIHAGRAGFSQPSTPRDLSPCAATIDGDDVCVRHGGNETSGWPAFDTGDALHFFAGAPITRGRGLRLGAVCIYDRQARPFGLADRETLAVLAAIVMADVQLPRPIRTH